MPRQRQRAQKTAKQNRRTKRPPEPPEADTPRHRRRAFLLRARNYAIAAAIVGGASWYVVEEVRATAREHDLSEIGKGVPTVVQIHDPNCPRCRALQREARDAMDAFAPNQLRYLVANIQTDEGRALARRHGVGHVTLLLFDGAGERRDVLAGPNSARRLERAFRRHVNRYGPK